MSVETQKVLLIGLDGFGRNHLKNLARLAEAGKAELIAAVSLSDPGPEVRGDIDVYDTLDQAQAAGHAPDVVIVSTPINTHYQLASQALAMGADVAVEKPPMATMAQFEDLVTQAHAAGRRIQVGFQSQGSHALTAINELLASGRIGKLRAVGATGRWVRPRSYYARAPWAGKRVLNGAEVVDGVITNPLAHAVQMALYIGGARQAEDVADLNLELYHAHRIAADDTSTVQLRTSAGIPVTAALTLCSAIEPQEDPWVTVFGTEGEARFYYTKDVLEVLPNKEAHPQNSAAGQAETLHFDRTNLVENLIDVRTGAATELISPLAEQGAFMQVLEAVRTTEEPRTIAEEHLEFRGTGEDQVPLIPHIENYVTRVVKAASSSYSSLGAPWAAEPALSGELAVTINGSPRPVADLRTGEDISPTDSPRPFLDEVRTLGGVVVSDQQPEDHTWHLGVGVAVQDVNGTNFWGGRTYRRESGRYIWRADHGRIQTLSQDFSTTEAGQSLVQQLEWDDVAGHSVLREERHISVAASAQVPDAWALDFAFDLSPADDEQVTLGSPGSHGRIGGGYGGFFWRLPQVHDALVVTSEAEGEEAVHGTVTDWLAISGEFAPLPSRRGRGGLATVILLRGAGDGPGASGANPDPWFVRYNSYPGLGMSLAWDTALVLSPGDHLQRCLRALVVDGRLSADEISGLIADV